MTLLCSPSVRGCPFPLCVRLRVEGDSRCDRDTVFPVSVVTAVLVEQLCHPASGWTPGFLWCTRQTLNLVTPRDLALIGSPSQTLWGHAGVRRGMHRPSVADVTLRPTLLSHLSGEVAAVLRP